MSWKDIVRKGHCMASKMDTPCDCSECMKKAKNKPDYLDFDKDGDKEESMLSALESAKKACGPNCGCKSCGGETEKSAYKSRRCETCNSKVSGVETRCKKCKGKSKGRGFTR